LRRVEQLVADMRDAGLAVRVGVHGDLSILSPGVDLAGYRIIQEALTNALKHASGARVEAAITCSEKTLVIEVIDDGGASASTADNHAGNGLVGMRERATLYGGEMVAGPTPDGGFAVRARIPLEVA